MKRREIGKRERERKRNEKEREMRETKRRGSSPHPDAVVPGLALWLCRLHPKTMTHSPTAQAVAALHLVCYDPHLATTTGLRVYHLYGTWDIFHV